MKLKNTFVYKNITFNEKLMAFLKDNFDFI